MIEHLAPAERVHAAEDRVQQLRAGDFAAIREQLASWLVNASTDESLQQMASLFPAGTPTEIDTVGFHTYWHNGSRSDEVILQYRIANQWLIVEYETRDYSDRTWITSFHAKHMAGSLDELNRFLAPGKTLIEWIFLVLCCVCLGISVAAFVICLRTRPLRRKWLWACVTLVGGMGIWLDWTTGEFTTRLFYLHFPTATLAAGAYQPYLFICCLPIGTIVFLALRDGLRRGSQI